MALIRREPARELQTFQSEVNRLFGTFFDSQTGARAARPRRWIPAIDLVEDDEHYVLSADLPGVGQDEVKVEVQDNVLTISGERRSETREQQRGYYRVERASGSFARSLSLPEGTDAEGIEASYENGVLELRIPKPAQPQPRRVAISVAPRGASSSSKDAGEGSQGAPQEPAQAA
jgi:HSP20 family protein